MSNTSGSGQTRENLAAALLSRLTLIRAPAAMALPTARLEPIFRQRGATCQSTIAVTGYLATDAGILVDAFEGALKALRLVDRNDPAALVVANHIITFAKTGVLDPVRLRDLTLEAVRIAAPVTDPDLASRNSGPPLWVINLVCGARLLATEPDHAHQVLPLQ